MDRESFIREFRIRHEVLNSICGFICSARLVRMNPYDTVLNGHQNDVGYMGYPPDSEFLLHLQERWLCERRFGVPETRVDVDSSSSLRQQSGRREDYEHGPTHVPSNGFLSTP